jgi:N-acetylmuramoyl-L-alanine amidase
MAAQIAIDVGHTLKNPGAISARGIAEFEFNRTLALEIAAGLRLAGHEVLLIGVDGDLENLYERASRARGRDLLISIHHDSVQPHYLESWEYDGVSRRYSDRFGGFSLFVARRNGREEDSLRCATALGAALRQTGLHPSRYHAEPITGENRPFADELNGVHSFDNLAVLRTATIPAILFEAGVIVNRDEELRMHDGTIRAAMVSDVIRAVDTCLPRATNENNTRKTDGK